MSEPALSARLPDELRPAPDAALLRHAIGLSSFPAKEQRSFALHTPLELVARHALLPWVAPEARELVRVQLLATGEHYRNTTEPHPFDRATRFDPDAHTPAALVDAIGKADVTAAAEVTSGLVLGFSAGELLRALLPETLDSLAAAGHAPIFFQRLGAIDDALAADARPLLVALVPELARTPQLRFEWTPQPATDGSPLTAVAEREVDAALGAVIAGPDAQPFTIFQIVHQGEADGLPDRVLGPALAADWTQRDTVERLSGLACRIAVRSMLAEPPTHSKYGWTHTLTLAHASRTLARLGGDPVRAARNALLYALASRHTMATTPLPETPELPAVDLPFAAALETDPDIAAAASYHAAPEDHAAVWTTLVTEAATRNDAHLVKHTLSALEMSREDPEAAPLYRAAAAKLAAIWIAEQPTASIRDILDHRT